jgi:succinate-semialdehyde dehydrogenase / glutarate-semialdehyde dehydrogenase
VQAGVYDAFAQKLAAAVAKLQVGEGTDSGVTTGPLINSDAIAKVQRHLDDALQKGAKILAGGKPHVLGGNFFEPTVITDVDSSMLVAREETFGPLAPLFKFTGVDEVIRQANDTEFGLAAYFYGRDLSLVWKVAEALEYGMVGVNTGLISTEVAPFGGIKSSGLGREGSKYGIEEYLEMKYICLSV